MRQDAKLGQSTASAQDAGGGWETRESLTPWETNTPRMPSIHKKTRRHKKTRWNSASPRDKKPLRNLANTLIPKLESINSTACQKSNGTACQKSNGTACQKSRDSHYRRLSLYPCLKLYPPALNVCPALDRMDQCKPDRVNRCKTRASQRLAKISTPSPTKQANLSAPQTNLERLVSEFCQKRPKMDFLMQLQYGNKHSDLSELANQLEQVIDRIVRSTQDRMPLLEKGGGRGLVITKRNLPCLKRLYTATKMACRECVFLINLK